MPSGRPVKVVESIIIIRLSPIGMLINIPQEDEEEYNKTVNVVLQQKQTFLDTR